MAKRSKIRKNGRGGRGPRLRWNDREKCWRFRRTINGKEHAYWVGRGGSGPDDEVAFARAVQEAVLKEEMLSGSQELRAFAAQHTEQMQEVALQVEDLHRFFSRPLKDVMERIIVNQEVPHLLQRAWRAAVLEQVVEARDARIAELEAMLAAHGRAAVTDASARLDKLMSKWIESVKNEKKAAGQTSNHIGSFRSNIAPFVAFLAEQSPPMLLTRDLEAGWRAVADYREYVIEEMNEKERSRAWGKGRLDKARLFCEYLVKNAYLTAVPRGIDRHWSRVGTDDPSPTFFSIEEVRKLWDAADDRIRLVIALGLNAGYRQADLRTLRLGEIDLNRGEIRRQRGKRNTAQAHKLWPVTRKLLEAHLDAYPDDLPFGTGYSNISRQLTAFVDSTLKTENNTDPRRTAKSFRSTGAQELERIVLGTAPHIIDQYLAHGDKKLAKHYREQELAALYDALDKLGEAFGLDKPRSKKKRPAGKRTNRRG